MTKTTSSHAKDTKADTSSDRKLEHGLTKVYKTPRDETGGDDTVARFDKFLDEQDPPFASGREVVDRYYTDRATEVAYKKRALEAQTTKALSDADKVMGPFASTMVMQPGREPRPPTLAEIMDRVSQRTAVEGMTKQLQTAMDSLHKAEATCKELEEAEEKVRTAAAVIKAGGGKVPSPKDTEVIETSTNISKGAAIVIPLAGAVGKMVSSDIVGYTHAAFGSAAASALLSWWQGSSGDSGAAAHADRADKVEKQVLDVAEEKKEVAKKE
ncbi:hypothetical protein M427DRAFT_67564 [Gonapodya prolifera JEL478]|uniref:Uncharacterized protein n=1 Tax=Gonapodya prolifera (strain JEL478) TaxID=1344416 RepID=A0A139AQK7_GONPJ|nr:hypothetical protein M427DRAFT_67564 [Gonapodya prolifera JEL478]|eukprot:KXS19002.1 hypothetical protein M427DRAFT_67564 [Gonapodya prolifera JEL478]